METREGTRRALDYLFEVEFTDGTIYQQNQRDVSFRDPSKSCWSDVVERLDEVKTLTLFGKEKEIVLSLPEGVITVNGVPVMPGECHASEWFPPQIPDHPDNRGRRALYHRQWLQRRTTETNLVTGERVGEPQDEHATRYVLGWSVVVGGVEHFATLSVE